jgi:hypothetical protein
MLGACDATPAATADGRIGLVLESLNAGGSDLWWATVELADRR